MDAIYVVNLEAFSTRSHLGFSCNQEFELSVEAELRRLFTDHPATVGETYLEHFLAASSFGIRMVLGGLACLLHAILPFMFVKTGSHAVTNLYVSMVKKRDRSRPTSDANQSA